MWRDAVHAACAAKRSIAPDATLPSHERSAFTETRVQVTNEITLGASRRFVDVRIAASCPEFRQRYPTRWGVLSGARAQEKVLCRSSALYQNSSTIRCIRSTASAHNRIQRIGLFIPLTFLSFAWMTGRSLPHPWPLSFITCAAPYAPLIGQPQAGDLLQKRIHRVLAIARAYGHTRSCWAHGVVVLLRMIRTVLPRIFGRPWKMTMAGRSPTLSLPLPIGHRSGSFLGLSVMCLLQRRMHKTLQGDEAPQKAWSQRRKRAAG